MPSSKAAAEEWSYGIKIGGGTSFVIYSPTAVEEAKKGFQALYQKLDLGQVKLDALEYGKWNPWFGAALYMEYAFDDHIGLDTELLYNRFDDLIKTHSSLSHQTGNSNVLTSTHTIGHASFLTWYWTAAIEPNF